MTEDTSICTFLYSMLSHAQANLLLTIVLRVGIYSLNIKTTPNEVRGCGQGLLAQA